MKGKINEIASKFATALAVALVGWTALAGLVVQKAQKDQVWNDEEIVTNAYLTGENASGAARPLPKYLWIADFDDSYPEEAKEYYRFRGAAQTFGGCSSARDGGFLYRNFDYPFDDRAEFVVKMSAGKGRFASVGVAQVGTNLTEQIVTSGKPEYSHLYKWLPGATVDGINENGVACNINVVGGDPQTSGWLNDTGDLHPLAAIRWILDNATNAQHAAEYIASHIAFPAGWTQNFHYMVCDSGTTWFVEDGVAFGSDSIYKFVITNFKIAAESAQGDTGRERYYLLLGGANITNAWYTRAYRRETNPPWVSDLAEVIDYTNDIFNAWASHPKEYFRGKTNNGIPWWQTVHTSVYDLTNRVLRVAVQETDDWYVFQVPSAGGTDEAKVREIAEAVVAPVRTTAAQALDDANTADTHALLAQGAANTARALAQTAQITADRAASDAAIAQSTADQAVTDAATAQSTADEAVTDAATAQSTADQAASDAATAQATADNAQATADNAQSTADQAASDAAMAQSTADQAASDAAMAQSTADQAASDAANAQTTADQAVADAANAQTTADQAVADAANAQATADEAYNMAISDTPRYSFRYRKGAEFTCTFTVVLVDGSEVQADPDTTYQGVVSVSYSGVELVHCRDVGGTRPYFVTTDGYLYSGTLSDIGPGSVPCVSVRTFSGSLADSVFMYCEPDPSNGR